MGRTPRPFAGYGYDAANLAAEAIPQESRDRPEASLRDSLEKASRTHRVSVVSSP